MKIKDLTETTSSAAIATVSTAVMQPLRRNSTKYKQNKIKESTVSELDHEIRMAKSDLYHCAKNAAETFQILMNMSEQEGLEAWVQEKITKANDYLNTVKEHLETKNKI